MKIISKYWKEKLHEIVEESDTPIGKWFDIILLWSILLSVIVVMLESVHHINQKYYYLLKTFEWFFTFIFTIEYIIRIITANKPYKYIFSYYGLVDFFSTIPSYLAFFIVGGNFTLVIRTLRLLRIFRILKLKRYSKEAQILIKSIRASVPKITVFLIGVLIISLIVGTLMYIIEGKDNGFTSIPRSVYWTIVTMTTVGYGDIAPNTPLGQFIAAFLMIVGYGVLAIPTGIVIHSGYEAYKKEKKLDENFVCKNCGAEEHHKEAKFCYNCGQKL